MAKTPAKKKSTGKLLLWALPWVLPFLFGYGVFYKFLEHSKPAQAASGITNTVPLNLASKSSEQVEYAIDVMLPSIYNDTQILLDGAPAKITSRTPGVVTLLARQQEAAHQLQVVQNGNVLRQESFSATSNHTVIKPFQY
jgi:hypothetical protein